MKPHAVTRERLVEMVTEAIFEVAKIRIPPDRYGSNLLQLGLDSLKAIQVLNILEDRLDVMIDDSNLRRFTSIDAIADFFDSLPRA